VASDLDPFGVVLERGRIAVKYVALALLLTVGYLSANPPAAQPVAPPPAANSVQIAVPANPAIDMDGYLKIAAEAAKHRATHRVTEDDFIKMSQEQGTIVLDARSKEMYDLKHVKGAINLSFPNIAIESLKKTLPDKEARILIYCNNNFTDPTKPAGKGIDARAFASKAPTASLNISTFIALYNYGYKNVYELAPLVDPAKSKLAFVTRSDAK
jgi:phage shock protein E